MDFNTLFQFLSFCHEFVGNTGALEALNRDIAATHELIRGCQTYLTFLGQHAPHVSEVLAPGTYDVIQGHLADNQAILRGMEDSRRALLNDQQRIVLDIVTIIPR
jgi:hypothetical protein